MPSSTFLNLAPEKQEKLLTAAAQEFTERPYNEASINKIIQAAGIPRGSFYMYFRDKEDLFRYLIQESVDALLLAFEEILRSCGGDVFAALPVTYDYLRSHREWDRSLGGMGMMAAITACNSGGQNGIMLKFMDRELILKRMEACVNPDLLDLRQPEDLTLMLRMLMILLGPILYDGLQAGAEPDGRKKLEQSLQILRRGMGAKPIPAQQ